MLPSGDQAVTRSLSIKRMTSAGSNRPFIQTVFTPEAVRGGVRAGMPVREAARRCPGVVLLPVNELLYQRAAAAIATLLHAYSPLVEPTVPGQSYLDLTGTGRLFGHATDVAARIRREIAVRLRLSATVGVATNKLVSREYRAGHWAVPKGV